jgi:hypothetical protein
LKKSAKHDTTLLITSAEKEQSNLGGWQSRWRKKKAAASAARERRDVCGGKVERCCSTWCRRVTRRMSEKTAAEPIGFLS